MGPARIPNDREHEVFRLNCVPFSFMNFFISWWPGEFIIRTQVKPRLIEGDDVMPCSIALDFEYSHSQSSPEQIDSFALLRI
jgi:hypothetical protein